MRFTFPCLIIVAVAMLTAIADSPAQGAIVPLGHYDLGEAGSLGASNRPRDSVGGHHFTNGSVSGPTVPVVHVPQSTRALHFNGIGGVYGIGGVDFVPVDNFVVELFVRTSNPQQDNNVFLSFGSSLNRRLQFSIIDGNWAVEFVNNAWVGGEDGAGQPIQANRWTSLAMVRDSGVSTLYINGVAQPGTTTVAPITDAGIHLGIQPGGQRRFFGDMDQLRIFSFDPLTDDPVAALLAPVPEPSTALLALVGLGLLVAVHRRRRVK